MRILVTGGLGFIGSNLVDMLVKFYPLAEIFVLDNLSSESASFDHANEVPTYVFGNCNNITELVTGKFDKIFHLAALARMQPSFEDPMKYFVQNAMSTISIAEYARLTQSGIIVYATTSSKNHGSPYLTPYTFSKVTGEEIVKMYNYNYGLNCAIATFYNVYGPREPEKGEWATVIAKFRRQYKNGEKLTVVGDGKQKRDFTHVDDICRGLIAISERNWDAEEFDLGKGEPYSIMDIAVAICDSPEKIEHVGPRRNEGEYTLANAKRSEEMLGWKAHHNVLDYIRSAKDI